MPSITKIFAAVACAFVLAAPAPSLAASVSAKATSNAATGKKFRAAVFEVANSPLLEEISAWADLVPYTKGMRLSGVDLVVIDGDEHAGQELQSRNNIIDMAFDAGVPVLFVDMGEDDKQSALGARLGFYSPGKSLGVLVDQPRGKLRGEGRVIELASPERIEFGEGNGNFPRRREQQGAPASAGHTEVTRNDARTAGSAPGSFSATVREYVEQAPKRRLAKSAMATTCDQTNSDQPSCYDKDLAYFHFTPWTVVYRGDKVSGCLPGEESADGEVRGGFQGYSPSVQCPSFSLTHSVKVYLNNAPQTGPPYKVVYLQVDGSATPGTGVVPAQIMKDLPSGRYWYQSVFEQTYTLMNQDGTGENITYAASSPQTANNVTSVTDSTSFSIGFKIAGKGVGNKGELGGGLSAGVTIGHSETRQLTDWAVDETTVAAQNRIGWVYRLNRPYNGDRNYAWWCDAFHFDGVACAALYNSVKEIPPLSKMTLQTHVQGVWRLDASLNDTTVVLAPQYRVRWDAAGCHKLNPNVYSCPFDGSWINRREVNFSPSRFYIDLRQVASK